MTSAVHTLLGGFDMPGFVRLAGFLVFKDGRGKIFGPLKQEFEVTHYTTRAADAYKHGNKSSVKNNETIQAVDEQELHAKLLLAGKKEVSIKSHVVPHSLAAYCKEQGIEACDLPVWGDDK